MTNKKRIIDIVFIITCAVIITVLIETGVWERYIGFSLIPIISAYFFGQYIERKSIKKKQNQL